MPDHRSTLTSGPGGQRLRRLSSAYFWIASRSWLITLGLGAIVVTTARLGPDWPAAEFRQWLARSAGFSSWNNQWYDGHALPGYSVLSPPITAVLGGGIAGLAAATVATWLASRLLPQAETRARRHADVVAAVVVVGNLLLGQIPFLLGMCFGLASCLALRRGRPWLAALAAAACSLASPLAGLFLVLGGIAWARDLGRRGWPLACAPAALLVPEVLGGAGGPFPYPWTGLLGVVLFGGLLHLLAPVRDGILRRFGALYGVVGALLFLVPNPVGGNIERLGKLLALPLAVYLLVTRVSRQRLVALAVLPALGWQVVPVASAVAAGAGDHSRSAGYYSGLLSFLATQDPTEGRVEVPFTQGHWESAYVARRFALARGWERQLDLQYNDVLYHPLTAASYRTWLNGSGVALVALPDAPLDGGGRAEAQLLAHPPSYLHLVWSDEHWHVWRVLPAPTLASGAGTLTQLGTSSFTVDFASAGTSLVRIRASSLWSVTSGDACLAATPDGWLQVQSAEPGPVSVAIHLSIHGLTDPLGDCSDLHHP